MNAVRRGSLLLILLSMWGFKIHAQHKKLNKIILKIKKQEFLFEDLVLSKQSLKYVNELDNLSTNEELIKLSGNNCKLCFSYAFWVLSKRNYKNTKKLYKHYIENQSSKYVELNNYTKSKNCIKSLYSENNFVDDIYKERKYLKHLVK